MIGRALARLVARLFLSRADEEFIVGDLEERHAARRRELGPVGADLVFLRDVIGSVVARRAPRLRSGSSGGGILDGILSDVHAAVRALVRDPAFTLVAALTLALGTGATIAVFGMANQLLLRPLPGVRDPEGAAYLQLGPAAPSQVDRMNPRGLSQPDFDELRRSATLLEGIGSYSYILAQITVGEGRPTSLEASTVYGDFFEVLDVRAAEGRLLSAPETALGASPDVLVISQALRARLFGADASAVGRAVRINGHSMTIIGVADGGFAGPDRRLSMDAWVPWGALVPLAGFPPDRLTSRESTMHGRGLVTRPRSGVSFEVARAEVDAILSRLAVAVPAEDRDYVGGLRAHLYAGLGNDPGTRAMVARTLSTLALIAALALAITCANVCNLLLFRGLVRRADIAVRRALGASFGRIARQQLIQSGVLASIGIAGGVATAWALTLLFRGEELRGGAAFEGFSVDRRVLAFAIGATVVTTLLFGGLPSLLVGRFELKNAMGAPRSAGSLGHSAVRTGLAAGQLALALTLLVGSLLLTRMLIGFYRAETGFDIDRVVEVRLEPPRGLTKPLPEFLEDVSDRVAAVPGVEAVAFDTYGPHSRASFRDRIAHVNAAPGSAGAISVNRVTPGWYEVFGVQLVDGRALTPEDVGSDAPQHAVVTASLARRLFGRTQVAGQSVVLGTGARAREVQIVGVTSDLSNTETPDVPEDALYAPFGAQRMPGMVLFARVDRESAETSDAIRRALEAAFPDQAIMEPTPLMARVDATHSERRVFVRLLQLLAGFAVVLASIGLYAVVAFGVATRRREIRIRLALGARRSSVAALVAHHGVSLLIVGGTLGLFGAWWIAEVLRSRFVAVTPTDPAAWLAGAALIVAAVAAACAVPTVRAVTVDPAATLREE